MAKNPIPLVLFSPLRRLYQPCLNEGCSHTMIVSCQMPAHSCVDQVLKERYLLILANLPLFVSDKLLDQLQNPPPSFGHHHL